MRVHGRDIRRGAAPGLFDSEERLALLGRHGDPLARLDAVVDWGLFLPRVEAVRADARRGRALCG